MNSELVGTIQLLRRYNKTHNNFAENFRRWFLVSIKYLQFIESNTAFRMRASGIEKLWPFESAAMRKILNEDLVKRQ